MTTMDSATAGERPRPEPPRGGMTVDLMTYDFPLRHDLTVRLTLPVELTEADAERLIAFIRSLQFAEEQS